MKSPCSSLASLGMLISVGSAFGAEPNHAFFENRVRPILVQHCYECHSEQSGKQKGDLLLDRPSGWLEGGSSGPAVVPGDIEKSLLSLAISHEDEDYAMPKEKLPQGMINVLNRWIQMGAPGPKKVLAETEFSQLGNQDYLNEKAETHWSFQPVERPELPETAKGESKNPVDRFLLRDLKKADLAFSDPANRRTQLRRLSYDLTGLPPTPEEVDAFLTDTSPEAYSNQVDRLLESPHFGERWGRQWLDIARYADTREWQAAGRDSRYPFAYTYRDWVVQAFNDDLPYDEFLRQQIAADFYTDAEDDPDLAAMGFITVGSRFRNNREEIINDRIDTLTRGVMGLTVSCARCHDHKYDPIPTSDYYALHGVFRSIDDTEDYPVIDSGSASDPKMRADYEKQLAEAKQAKVDYAAGLAKEAREEFAKDPETHLEAIYDMTIAKSATVQRLISGGKLSESVLTPIGRNIGRVVIEKKYLNDPFWRPAALLLEKPAKEFPAAFQAFLAEEKPKSEKGGRIDPSVWTAITSGPAPKTAKELLTRYGGMMKEAFAAPAKPAHAVAMAEVKEEDGRFYITPEAAMNATTISGRGRSAIAKLDNAVRDIDAEHPAAPARAMIVNEAKVPAKPVIYERGDPANRGDAVERRFLTAMGGKTFAADNSGRKDLAESVASESNFFTTRSAVDRIWRNLMGKSLLPSPDDMGLQSPPPSHPELLDYLASRFVSDGWSTKKLVRMIVLSRGYRQSSDFREEGGRIDPENRLYWRRELKRLDFEAMRDSMLAAAKNLDLSIGGRAVEITAPPYTNRRTVYARIDRVNLDDLFATFDFPSPDQSAPERPETLVPQQALYGMNDGFVIHQARALSRQLGDITEGQVRVSRINHLYRQLYQRNATPFEIQAASEFLDSAREGREVSNSFGWTYGFGDPEAPFEDRLKPFPFFDGQKSSYQFSKGFPHPKMSHLRLSLTGGHPGKTVALSPIRRWTAPYDATFRIQGELQHSSENGDGVRLRILSSRQGLQKEATAHNEAVNLNLKAIEVKEGESLDFIVDCMEGPTADGFRLTLEISHVGESEYNLPGMMTQWNSQNDFSGPPPPPLTSWEQLAHALFMTNEFLFVE